MAPMSTPIPRPTTYVTKVDDKQFFHDDTEYYKHDEDDQRIDHDGCSRPKPKQVMDKLSFVQVDLAKFEEERNGVPLFTREHLERMLEQDKGKHPGTRMVTYKYWQLAYDWPLHHPEDKPDGSGMEPMYLTYRDPLEDTAREACQAALRKAKGFWDASKSATRLYQKFEQAATTSVKIKKIVCFGLGHKEDTDSPTLEEATHVGNCLQHLAVITIANALDSVYRAEDDSKPPVKIVLQDHDYTSSDKELWTSENSNIEFVTDPDGFLAVDEHTLVISAYLSWRVPLLQICADLIPNGPAGFLHDNLRSQLDITKRFWSPKESMSPKVVKLLLERYEYSTFNDYPLERGTLEHLRRPRRSTLWLWDMDCFLKPNPKVLQLLLPPIQCQQLQQFQDIKQFQQTQKLQQVRKLQQIEQSQVLWQTTLPQGPDIQVALQVQQVYLLKQLYESQLRQQNQQSEDLSELHRLLKVKPDNELLKPLRHLYNETRLLVLSLNHQDQLNEFRRLLAPNQVRKFKQMQPLQRALDCLFLIAHHYYNQPVHAHETGWQKYVLPHERARPAVGLCLRYKKRTPDARDMDVITYVLMFEKNAFEESQSKEGYEHRVERQMKERRAEI